MPFEFLQPNKVNEAVDMLARYQDGAMIIAGGAAMVPAIQQKRIDPRVLVSLERVAEMQYVRADADGLHLGPMNSQQSLVNDRQIRERFPALSSALCQVGNIRVRNQATIGGNLALADYASDPPAVLSALDASITAASSAGARRIPLQDFFRGHNATVLRADELLTDIFIPSLPAGARQVYIKYRSRSGEDRPCVGVAAVARFQDGTCVDLHIAIGAACRTPYRNPAMEQKARGRKLDGALIAEIAEGYAAAMDPVDDLRGSAWYHRQVTRVFVRRALEEIWMMEGA